MPALFSNNASATLASSISSSATTITVSTGQGALFPTMAAGEYILATLTDSSNNLEVVKITNRVSDVLTVLRGQDGTTARAYAAADRIELRIPASALNNFVQLDGAQTITGAKTFTTAPTLNTPLAVASGGSGSSTATGSGSLVLANSPTLITPNLGTPSAGNLANCTFPTLNQSTSGNAATATAPQSGGSFITTANIGSQSVSYASNAGTASSANAVAWGNVSSKPTLGTLVGSYNTGYLGDGANGSRTYDIPYSTVGYYGVPMIKVGFDYWVYFNAGYGCQFYISSAQMAWNGDNILRIVMQINGSGQRWPYNFYFYFYA